MYPITESVALYIERRGGLELSAGYKYRGSGGTKRRPSLKTRGILVVVAASTRLTSVVDISERAMVASEN
jgi:hypothetical protein